MSQVSDVNPKHYFIKKIETLFVAKKISNISKMAPNSNNIFIAYFFGQTVTYSPML